MTPARTSHPRSARRAGALRVPLRALALPVCIGLALGLPASAQADPQPPPPGSVAPPAVAPGIAPPATPPGGPAAVAPVGPPAVQPPAVGPPVAPPATKPLAVAVSPDKAERAKQALALHDEAWALYEEGRYRAAIERLEAALQVDPDGRELVYNVALLHEKLGHLELAQRYYRRYLETETDPRARTRIQTAVRRLEGAQREAVEWAPPPPSAPPPLALDRAPSARTRSWTIAAATLAGGAFVTGLGFGLTALVKDPGPTPRTGGAVSIATLQADAHAAHADAVVADVAFVLAAAASVAAVLVHVTGPRRSPAASAAIALGSFARPDGIGVRF
jgi:hypothetical protein